MLIEGLYSLITADADVKALLAGRVTPSDRAKTTGVFPVQLPEGEPLPAIVYSQIYGDGVMTMDGPDLLRFARFQFSCYAEKPIDAKRLARTLLQKLEEFTGLLEDGTVIGNMQRAGETDAFEEVPYVFVTHADVYVTYDDVGS